MDSETLISIVIVLAIMLLVGFPVHEFAHAFAAYRLGDGTAKLFGRLTLNPIVHFDPIGGVLLAASFLASQGAFAFGWAKPTPVNPNNLQGGRQGEAFIAYPSSWHLDGGPLIGAPAVNAQLRRWMSDLGIASVTS